MSSRISVSLPNLHDIRIIVERIENINSGLNYQNDFGGKNHLRTRSIHYDDKHCTYLIFVDYLISEDFEQEFDEKSILDVLRQEMNRKDAITGEYVINCPECDVLRRKCSMFSDSFDVDHKSYYTAFLESFESGRPRNEATSAFFGSCATSWKDPVILESGVKVYKYGKNDD